MSDGPLDFHNWWHLGDCLYQLHFCLRLWKAQGIPSRIWCKPEYIEELRHFISPGVGVSCFDIASKPDGSIDSWIGRDSFHQLHGGWNEYDTFYVDFFADLAKRVGVESPIKSREDMLFDSPAILEKEIPEEPFVWLVINAKPQSGQWDYDPMLFMRLVQTFQNRRQRVITTHPSGIFNVPATVNMRLPVAAVAKLSTRVRYILAIDTGPTGSTFNIWNKDVKRFILHKTNHFSHPNTVAVHRPEDVWRSIRDAL